APASPGPAVGKPRLDVPGLLLIAPGISAVLLGLANASTAAGFAHADVIIPLIAGVALLAAFTGYALHTSHPLVDVRLLGRPPPAARCCSSPPPPSRARCSCSRCTPRTCAAPPRSPLGSCSSRRASAPSCPAPSSAATSTGSAHASSPWPAPPSSPPGPSRSPWPGRTPANGCSPSGWSSAGSASGLLSCL